MMILHNRLIPFGTYKAINLLGIIFTKMPLTHAELRHEQIHTRQMLEMLVIGFYVWYVVEWGIRLVQYRDSHIAYLNISFEREAYAQQNQRLYLRYRPPFASMRYLTIRNK
ncbi:MAG: hypothetical protein IJ139_06130 [Bacteroidaceae bacterium]|nr:hypothetical protein [Bacteroidaceae bacterium]MBQ9176429.1 hypothetical protein [Bacteroidaceae bacterium]